MSNESNLTSKVVFAAAAITTCYYAKDHNSLDNLNNMHASKYPYTFVDNNYDNLSERLADHGTVTIYWSQKNIGDQMFQLDYNTPNTIEIANELFSSSILLDETMSKVLSHTISRIGKDKTDLPNRL